MSVRPRIIQPDEIEQTQFPYLPVWPTLALIVVPVFVAGAAIHLIWPLIGQQVSAAGESIMRAALVVFPAALWAIVVWFREQRVSSPRRRLLIVLVVSMLAANAVMLPLINQVFQPQRWLPDQSAVNRIIGYALTWGTPVVITQYLAVYYVCFPALLRIRTDAVAYFMTSAVGVATVINFEFISTARPDIGVAAVLIATNVGLVLAAGLLPALGIAESRFSNASPFLILLSIVAGSAVYGAAFTFRSGLSSPQFALVGASASFLLATVLVAGVVIAVASFVAFFLRNSERIAREAALSRDE